jgi:hypothetical protein
MRLQALSRACSSQHHRVVITQIAFIATTPLLRRTALLIIKQVIAKGSPEVRKAMARSLIEARNLEKEDTEFDALGDPYHVSLAWDEWIASL